jgi:endonuclease-8
MPEGDTIFRAARTLNRALAGRVVTRFESVFPALTRVHDDAPITGRTVESITAAGKHVLMRFSGDLVLRTHMRMNGSWHIYRPGERWQRSRRDMRIVIATEAFEAVGFNVPVAEFLQGRAIQRQEDLRLMGPDLLGASFDEAEAMRRLRARGDAAIADALLNQRVVAGIGNVYKSEVLFLCGVNPFTSVADIDDERLRCLLTTARTHLHANVIDPTASIVTYRGYRRTTRRADPAERLYVYGRAGQPCRTCGVHIEIRAQGRDARLTYWCPSCQPASTSSSVPAPRPGQSRGDVSD